MSDLLNDLFSKKQGGLFEKAKFITTEYDSYFKPNSHVWVSRLMRNQKNDLEECDGLPVYIRDFEVDETSRATLYFTALGCADVYINGKRIGNDEFKPGWTDYNKRALYCTYDVTENIVKGKNRILAVVSPGWCYGRISGGIYGTGTPAFAAVLTNGAEMLVTDKSWLAKVCGRIRTADIWDGEFCDGNLPTYAEMSLPAFSTEDFVKVETVPYKGKITPYIGTTVKVRDGLTRTPQYINITDGVVYNGTNYGEVHICNAGASLPLTLKQGQTAVVDFGQEIVGWVKLTVKGEKDTVVRMRYAEFLNDSGSRKRGNDGPMGSVYTVNYRSALAKAYYRLNGDGTEIYRPKFSFFGFRFVEITAENDVELLGIEGEVVGNDNRETGYIETSSPLVNKLFSNIIWGQRGNYLSVPTDCPQRDERLGWTGDAQAFSTTAAYNADVYPFFLKWMQDMRDSQTKNGGYCDVNPAVGYCKGDNAAAWGDAGVIIPYNMYRMFGDKQILEEHYDSMDDYINGVIKQNGYSGPNPRYGDWLAYDQCKNDMISSAYLVHDIDLMIEMSDALGKADKVEEYRKHRDKAKKYFDKHYMKNGMPKGSTQTDKILVLAFDLTDGACSREIASQLEQQIAENGNRLSSGFVGTCALCPTLSKFGLDKTAYNLLLQRSEPSWLYSVDQGATTIWERWNSYTKEKGFGNVGMNSFNHYAYGAVGEWMYGFMAGIQTAETGFRKITLTPRFDLRTPEELPEGQQNITYVNASYNSASGLIKSEWNTVNGIKYFCSVPVEATLYLPAEFEKITVDGNERNAADCPVEGGKIIISLAAGEHTVTLD
ncbi:MAG: family 78 glycoside hydrolase catalytic domain [Clostridia bacterium]|nr:family 78 glycoside hydrolase catalytic domain [Clostridia bacterium]